MENGVGQVLFIGKT